MLRSASVRHGPAGLLVPLRQSSPLEPGALGSLRPVTHSPESLMDLTTMVVMMNCAAPLLGQQEGLGGELHLLLRTHAR